MPEKNKADRPLTPLELEIMNVLWETGPATVQRVQEKLTARNLAYTTVQTMLNVLQRKGKVKRKLKDRAYLYQPVLSRQKAITQAVGDMVNRFFAGSAEDLVLSLLETRQLTPERLEHIQQMMDEKRKEDHGND